MKQLVDEMHRELWIEAPHLFRSARTWARPVIYSQSSESNETATVVSLALLSESGLKPA